MLRVLVPLIESVVEGKQQEANCSSFFTGVTTACVVQSTDKDKAFSIVLVVCQAKRPTPHICTGGRVDTRFFRLNQDFGNADGLDVGLDVRETHGLLFDTIVLVGRGSRKESSESKSESERERERVKERESHTPPSRADNPSVKSTTHPTDHNIPFRRK